MINIVMKTKERLKLFVQSLNMGQNAFEAEVGIANGYLASKSQSVNSDAIEKIIIKYPSLNLDWLFTGNGDMSLGEDAKSIQVTSEPVKGSIPFYKELPVSAGKLEVLQQYVDKEEGQGWIKLPDVSAIAAFPVKGCSMEPYINNGDFVAIAPVNRWDIVDPDKIYMIITKEDRMIKHLMVDNDDDSILWAVSPNYNKFRISKNEIVEIYRVVFYGRMA